MRRKSRKKVNNPGPAPPTATHHTVKVTDRHETGSESVAVTKKYSHTFSWLNIE